MLFDLMNDEINMLKFMVSHGQLNEKESAFLPKKLKNEKYCE